MAARKHQDDHDRMVRYMADFLKTKKFSDVRAAVPGFPAPEMVHAFEGQPFVPDLTGVGKQFHLFEVETEDTIYDEHGSREWTLFAQHAEKKNGIFWLVIPNGCRQQADQRLSELAIDAKILEV